MVSRVAFATPPNVPEVGDGRKERRVHRQPRHPGLVPQDRSAGARRRRVDGQHRDPVPLVDQVHAERLDGGGLAHPGSPGDAHAMRFARVGRQRQQELLRLLVMVGAGGFQQRDGPRQHRAVTAADGGRQVLD